MATNTYMLQYLRLRDSFKLEVLALESGKNKESFHWMTLSIYYKIINKMKEIDDAIALESLTEAGY